MSKTITRRSLLNQLGVGLAVAPLAHVLGCSDDGTDSTTGDECPSADEWASGGTSAMSAQDCYPDPFAADMTTCALVCWATEGPCTSTSPQRQDVSEAWPGLPVRLVLKFVHIDTCEPFVDARVDIWHTQRTGVYSGETPYPMICNGGDADAENHLYFRGSQTTDAEGRVVFDTCYPGWYPGRAIHIHFSVYRQETNLVSQLFFADELTEEIFASHPDYMEFGQPDTVNGDDSVIAGEQDLSPYLLETQRMPDGAMLAFKVIGIRFTLPECELGQ